MVHPNFARIRTERLAAFMSPPNSNYSPHAQIHWDDTGLPLSTQFDDYYFSKLDGLAETQYIFIEHNQLKARFNALSGGQVFTIGETGFGTGLNFLATWALWRQCAAPDTHLHFVSVEKFPLTKHDLTRALALWPTVANEARELLEQYPSVIHPGFHRLKFKAAGITLTLIIDDATTGLQQLLASQHPAYYLPQGSIDAWFLDGFSPVKNPEMWRPELFATIAQLSVPGTTLATFAAATIVKRGLSEQGFSIKTDVGFGRKREMVSGQLIEVAAQLDPNDLPQDRFQSKHPLPWGIEPADSREHLSARQAVIVGGGISGCHTARALADRGWAVTLIEQHPQLASEASGNPQGVLYAKLSHRQETLSDFNLLALQFAQRHYTPFWGSVGERCGVLQLAYNDKAHQLHEQLRQHFGQQTLFEPLDRHAASAQAGVDCPSGGLFFPSAGWINPATLCQQLTSHKSITVISNTQVQALDYHQQWSLQLQTNETGITRTIDSPVVILATANHAQQFQQTQQLPVKPIRGQVSYLKASAQTAPLKTVICGDGYFPPAMDKRHCIGATFDPRSDDLTPLDSDHQRNLNTLTKQLPSLAASLSAEQVSGGRAALRCTTPDYLPMVGSVPIYESVLQNYATLRKNARANIHTLSDNHPGLYVNIGYGSRGLAYAPICAELLAASLNSEPSPVGASMQQALHPARFWIRDLMRGKR